MISRRQKPDIYHKTKHSIQDRMWLKFEKKLEDKVFTIVDREEASFVWEKMYAAVENHPLDNMASIIHYTLSYDYDFNAPKTENT